MFGSKIKTISGRTGRNLPYPSDEAEKSINVTFRDLCGPIRAIWWDILPVSRDVHITFSFITFAANLLLNLVILSTPQFRKQVRFAFVALLKMIQIPQRSNAFMVALGFSDMFFVAFFTIRSDVFYKVFKGL